MFRSGAEKKIADWLTTNKIKWKYESVKLKYASKVYSGKCEDCGSRKTVQVRTYTPDFYLPDFKFHIEVKGLFNASARTKMKAVKECNPDADIRLVFLANNKINPRSETRYLDWAEQNNYKAAIKVPNNDWFS